MGSGDFEQSPFGQPPGGPRHATSGADSLSDLILQIFRDAGFSASAAQDALMVAQGESGLNPGAIGDQGTSFGLWQLHTQGLLPAFGEWLVQRGVVAPGEIGGPAGSLSSLAQDPTLSTQFVADFIAQNGPAAWQNWTVARNLAEQGTGPLADVVDFFDQRSSSPAFTSTQAGAAFDRETQLQILDEQHQNRLDQIQREWELGNITDRRDFLRQVRLEDIRHKNAMEILDKQQSFQERMDTLQQLTTLAQQASQFQQGAASQAAEMTGQDPFRAALMLQGGLQRGTTPAQKLRGRLLGIAGRDLPSPSRDALTPVLRSAVGQLQNFLQTPIVQPAIGLEHGGVIDMKRGGDGSFEMDDEPGQAVLVGESGPEILELQPRKGRIRVIPLMGAAQQGGSFNFSDVMGTIGSLSPIFQHIGIGAFNRPGGFPLVQRDMETFGRDRFGRPRQILGPMTPQFLASGTRQPVGSQPFTGAGLEMLGIRPRLFQVNDTLLAVGPDNQVTNLGSGIEGLQRLQGQGFNPSDVIDVGSFQNWLDLAARQGLVARNPNEGRIVPEDQFSPLSQISGPIVLPLNLQGTRGLMLAAPERISSLLPQLDPTALENVLQSYEAAGIPRASVLGRAEAFRPSGTAQLGLGAAPRLG